MNTANKLRETLEVLTQRNLRVKVKLDEIKVAEQKLKEVFPLEDVKHEVKK